MSEATIKRERERERASERAREKAREGSTVGKREQDTKNGNCFCVIQKYETKI